MRITVTRWLSLLSYLGLIAFMMLWIVMLGDVANEHKSLWLLLFVTPLLLPLRGVLAGRDKALIWGTLVILLYAVHGGMVAWSEPDNRWLGLLEVTLSLTFLVSASLFVRWRADAAASDQQAPAHG
jgi:uncharacterized membrane protein